jgi:hypothetical protein
MDKFRECFHRLESTFNLKAMFKLEITFKDPIASKLKELRNGCWKFRKR